MRAIAVTIGLVALVGCAPTVPDSAAGVGFGDYGEFHRSQQTPVTARNPALPAPQAVSSETLPSVNGAQSASAGAALDSAAQLASQATAALNSGQAPLDASPSNPAPQVAASPTGISNENDFENVSTLRSIESDAARIAQNRAQYQVVAPTALPSRDAGQAPNIVSYALQTTHPVGVKIYSRFAANQSRADRNCAKYASPERAQEDFLARGGPQKDRLGIDPDGDGFACAWDPTPFRRVNG